MKFIHPVDRYTCNLDPISLGIAGLTSALSGGAGTALAAGALGAGAGALGSSLASGGGGQTPTPQAPPPEPPATNSPVGTRSGGGTMPRQPTSPSFVGSSSIPSQSGYGGKTLLGQ